MIDIEDLEIRLGIFHLQHIRLHVERGEYLVLLGPTGAGKTVLLECLAGIVAPDSGSIRVRGSDISSAPPEERNIGYVPQDYALFPNMTVRENLGYGLKARKWPEAEIAVETGAMMRRLGITHLERRLPLHLSGGEKQRVALGRALVTLPDLLLLDEPLSALDESLRAQLAADLRHIQREWNRTFIHVCHNFEEAALVADRIAIMNHGLIEQIGTIEDILRSPANLFVAEFVRTQNLIAGCAEPLPGGCRITTPSGAVIESRRGGQCTGPVIFGVRPEEITLTEAKNGPRNNSLKASILGIRMKPSCIEVELDAGFRLITSQPWHSPFTREAMAGHVVWVNFPQEAVMVFPDTAPAHSGDEPGSGFAAAGFATARIPSATGPSGGFQ